jgi:hypothetical protein
MDTSNTFILVSSNELKLLKEQTEITKDSIEKTEKLIENMIEIHNLKLTITLFENEVEELLKSKSWEHKQIMEFIDSIKKLNKLKLNSYFKIYSLLFFNILF